MKSSKSSCHYAGKNSPLKLYHDQGVRQRRILVEDASRLSAIENWPFKLNKPLLRLYRWNTRVFSNPKGYGPVLEGKQYENAKFDTVFIVEI